MAKETPEKRSLHHSRQRKAKRQHALNKVAKQLSRVDEGDYECDNKENSGETMDRRVAVDVNKEMSSMKSPESKKDKKKSPDETNTGIKRKKKQFKHILTKVMNEHQQ